MGGEGEVVSREKPGKEIGKREWKGRGEKTGGRAK